MKFSRPVGCRSSSGSLMDMVERRFEKRLAKLHAEWKGIEVLWETITLDRVAL